MTLSLSLPARIRSVSGTLSAQTTARSISGSVHARRLPHGHIMRYPCACFTPRLHTHTGGRSGPKFHVHLGIAKLKLLVLAEGYPRDKLCDLWQLVFRFHKEEFPNLIKLAAIALTLPVHTADCERGFGVQNELKHPARNRLSPDRVDTLMTIKLGGPALENFNFNDAIQGMEIKRTQVAV